MPELVKTGMGAAAALDFDAELMLRVKDGDEASFNALLQKHRSAVIHFLYRMVLNQAVAEELAQEVFLRVYRSRSTYEPTAKFTTWLFRIATHLALNAIRDNKNERLQERLGERGHLDQAQQQVLDGDVLVLHPARLGLRLLEDAAEVGAQRHLTAGDLGQGA